MEKSTKLTSTIKDISIKLLIFILLFCLIVTASILNTSMHLIIIVIVVFSHFISSSELWCKILFVIILSFINHSARTIKCTSTVNTAPTTKIAFCCFRCCCLLFPLSFNGRFGVQSAIFCPLLFSWFKNTQQTLYHTEKNDSRDQIRVFFARTSKNENFSVAIVNYWNAMYVVWNAWQLTTYA